MSYILKGPLALGLLAGLTMPAMGQDLQSSVGEFYITGYGEVSYLDGNSLTETISAVEIDLGQPSLLGNFGFSLGIDAVHIDGTTNSELYPAVTYSFGDHIISAGMTRPVMDNGYLDDRQALNSAFLGLEAIGLVSGSNTRLALLQSNSSIRNIGLRWDGVYGNTKVGASYNRLAQGGLSSDVDVFSLAVRREIAQTSTAREMALFAGLEEINTGSADATNWIIGFEGQVNRLGYGFTIGDSEQILGQSLRGWLDYDVTEALTIGIEAINLNDADIDLVGITARYNAWSNIEVEASYIDQRGANSGISEISLRYRF